VSWGDGIEFFFAVVAVGVKEILQSVEKAISVAGDAG